MASDRWERLRGSGALSPRRLGELLRRWPRAWGPLRLLGVALVLGLFAYNAHRHLFLADDAFISFRYARNLVDGHGLVWNAGETVEGYTNFLWVLLMAAGMLAGVRPEVLSVLLGMVAGLTVLWVVLGDPGRRSGPPGAAGWLAAACLSFSRPFTAWSSSGLETLLFSALVLLALVVHARERERRTDNPWRSSLLFALATLTRPEGALFAAVAGALFLGEVAARRRSRGAFLRWVAPYAVLVGAHLLWRYSYYGAWLPNTFHAKVNGAWWEQGARYLDLFASDFRLHGFLPLVLVAVLVRPRFQSLLFAATTFVYCLYLAAIGGGFFGFRFLVPVLPLLYLLLARGLEGCARAGGLRGVPRRPLVAFSLGAGVWLLVLTGLGSERDRAERFRNGVNSVRNVARVGERRARDGKELRDLIEAGLLPADLRVAVNAAGAVPYYTGWYTVDALGLTDSVISRQEVDRRGIAGHEHRASLEYLEEKGVEAVELLGRFVYRARPRGLAGLRERAREAVAEANRRSRAAGSEASLHLECRRLNANRYLLFATTQPRARTERRLGHLKKCGRVARPPDSAAAPTAGGPV